MPRLLHIEASPRDGRSRSSAVARRLLDQVRAAAPRVTIDVLDIWREPLPAFSGETLDAKYAVLAKAEHTPAQAQAWRAVVALVERLRQADHLLISTPMWNLSIPYRLKHYIDLVTQPGLTFAFSPDTGYRGLISGVGATLVQASAGDFGSGRDPRPDFQKPYLRAWLNFIGVTDIAEVTVEPTVGAPEAIARGQARAEREADLLASRLLEALGEVAR
jgi:FMN-dependent NADH-azoreductase